MTCIAWDGTVLAADRMFTNGYAKGQATKIRRCLKAVIAACGNHGSAIAMLKWYEDGADHQKWPAFQGVADTRATLIVVTRGQCYYYRREPIPILCENKFWAWGTGSEVAIGAMAHGATAVRAVEIANEYADGCGNGVDWFVNYAASI